MKITVDYMDGRHYAHPWKEGDGEFVEIRDADWVALQTHLATDRLWQDKLTYLDNWLHEKRHPNEVVIPTTRK